MHMMYLSGRIGVLALIIGATVALGGCEDSQGSGERADATSADAFGDAGDAAEGCAVTGCERGMICDESTDECACGDVVCGEGTVCDADLGLCEVEAEAACKTGESLGAWAPGTPAFRDVSADWGLKESGARGQRISVADVNDDD